MDEHLRATRWGTFRQQEYLAFAPLFGHQYSHVWIDFRGIQDAYMRERGFDYFENSRRAIYAQRAYAIANPMGWKRLRRQRLGPDRERRPGRTSQRVRRQDARVPHYSARGAGVADAYDDGTLAPTAAVGVACRSRPRSSIPAVARMHERFGEHIYSTYGFLDAFNPSFDLRRAARDTGRCIPGFGWVASDYLGIDQGPIVAMIENYRSDLVWNVMRKNPYMRRGLQRAGFTGGWLDGVAPSSDSRVAAAPWRASTRALLVALAALLVARLRPHARDAATSPSSASGRWAAKAKSSRELLREFERAHPGVRVEVQQLPWTRRAREAADRVRRRRDARRRASSATPGFRSSPRSARSSR